MGLSREVARAISQKQAKLLIVLKSAPPSSVVSDSAQKRKKNRESLGNGNKPSNAFKASDFGWDLDCSSELKLLASVNLCCGTLVRAGSLRAKALPHLSSLMDSVLGALELSLVVPEGSVKENVDEDRDNDDIFVKSAALVRAHILLLRSSAVSLTGIHSAVPTFCHPYIQRTLTACLGLCASEDANNASSWPASNALSTAPRAVYGKGYCRSEQEWAALGEDVDHCLATVASNVPPRLAIPSLLTCAPELLAKGPACATRTCDFLQSTYTALDRQAILEHIDGISEVSAYVLDYYRAYGSATALKVLMNVNPDEKDTNKALLLQENLVVLGEEGENRVVNSATKALVSLCLKLTEPELKGLLARFAEWRDSEAVLSTASIDVSSVPGLQERDTFQVVHRGKYARITAYYRLLSELGRKLQSIFPPTMVPHWVHCAGVCVQSWYLNFRKSSIALYHGYVMQYLVSHSKAVM